MNMIFFKGRYIYIPSPEIKVIMYYYFIRYIKYNVKTSIPNTYLINSLIVEVSIIL